MTEGPTYGTERWSGCADRSQGGVEFVRRLSQDSPAYSVDFGPDSTQVLTGGATAQLWDVFSGSRTALHVQLPGSGSVTGVSFHPDGRHVILAGLGVAHLYDLRAGRSVRQFDGHSAPVWRVRVIDDGSRLVTFGQDGCAKLWDLHSGRCLRRVPSSRRGGDVHGIACSADGRLVAMIEFPWGVGLYDTRRGKRRDFWERPHEGATPTCSAFSPSCDSLFVGCYDGVTYLWEFEAGLTETRFARHGAHVQDVCVSPEGQHLLTLSADRTTRLWDVDDVHELAVLSDHSQEPFRAAFSHDGQYFATGSYDHTVCVYRITDR